MQKLIGSAIVLGTTEFGCIGDAGYEVCQRQESEEWDFAWNELGKSTKMRVKLR